MEIRTFTENSILARTLPLSKTTPVNHSCEITLEMTRYLEFVTESLNRSKCVGEHKLGNHDYELEKGYVNCPLVLSPHL